MGIPYAEVIGDPIAHSKSPIIHKFWLEKLGLDYDFRRTRVPPNDLAKFLQQRRTDPDWCGCNVTIPHKVEVVAHLDLLSDTARSVGAVNCVTRAGPRQPRLVGQNSDVDGFLEPLQPWLQSRAVRFATVIGTGGAAAAVTYALSRTGWFVLNVGRDWQKTSDFRRRLGLDDDVDIAELKEFARPRSIKWRGRDDVCDLLVNATPLGMSGFSPLPVDLRGEPPGLIVYDLIYHPLETPLLRDARALGLPVIDGLQMLVGQAAIAFELFFAEKPPREHDAELRELLTR